MNDVLLWTGRILFGGYFILMGLNHFMQAKNMMGYAASKGVPAPSLAVPLTGILLLIGGLGVLTGFYMPAALWALVVFLVPVTFMMHSFWALKDPMQKMGEMVNFMKNLALLGAVFALLALWK